MKNWHKLCYYLSEKITSDISEKEFEPIVEKGLEILGWDEFSGDFEITPNYQLGSTKNKMIPDFVVKSSQTGEKLFVIEIKRPKAPLSNQNQVQLSTYMRQFKLEFGILIGPQIQIFYDGKLNKKENATLLENIEFKRDNEKGKLFTELFSKTNFNFESLNEYAKKAYEKINERETEKEITKKLVSDDFNKTVMNLIEEKLSVEYDINLVSNALSKINLEISEKFKIQKIESKFKNHATNTEEVEVLRIHKNIPRWFNKSNQTNSRILIKFMELREQNSSVSVFDLKEICNDIDNFPSNYHAMKDIYQNNHAKVFEETGNEIILWEPVKDFIENEYRKYLNKGN